MGWWENLKFVYHDLNKPSNIEQMLLDQQKQAQAATSSGKKPTKSAEKQEVPEEMALIPETGDEDMIDAALEEDADEYEKPKKSKQDMKKKKEKAVTQEKPKAHTPTIDDLIGAVQNGTAPKPKLDIPDHLKAPKKIWVPGADEAEKTDSSQPQVIGGTPLNGSVQKQETQKMPPGFVSGPKDPLTGQQPFVFNIMHKTKEIPFQKFLALIQKLLVFGNPVQKAHALLGISELQKDTVYLWYDCASGKVGNTTNKLVRVYFIRDYDEFTGVDLKPNKMLDIPEDNKHVIMVHGDIDNVKSFYFLEDWMPIK